MCGRPRAAGPCAYLTRSTRGLRSALLSQGTRFAMPLVDPALGSSERDDLQDMRDFEREHPG
eukprot:jgi/Mesen1/1861/ME000143S00914